MAIGPRIDPNWPFAPRRLPFFYGWLIIFLGAIGVLASIPGQTAGVSVFTDPLLEATGLSRVALANAYLVGTLASGFMLPRGGRLLDRFGSRIIETVAAFALGAVLMFLSSVDRIARAVSDSEWVMLTFITLGFAALRFSGQGMMTLAARVMVVNWFSRKRGLASGLLSVSVSLGFSLAPAVLALSIDSFGGWREAWRGLAMIVGVGIAAFAWLLFRDTPEECGLTPDGETIDGKRDATEQLERNIPSERAIRTGAFWTILLGLTIQSCIITGLTFHIIDLGAEAGLSRNEAVALFPPMAAVSMVLSLLSGWAADRIRLRFLVGVLLAGQVVAYLGFANMANHVWLVVAIVGSGVASGMFGSLSTLAMAKLFGRPQVGSNTSILMSALVIGSAIGPSFLAATHALFGSYSPAFYVAAIFPVLVAILAFSSRDPDGSNTVW